MKNSIKRIISFIMVLSLILSTFVVSAWADSQITFDAYLRVLNLNGQPITSINTGDDMLLQLTTQKKVTYTAGQITFSFNNEKIKVVKRTKNVEGDDIDYYGSSSVSLTESYVENIGGSSKIDLYKAAFALNEKKNWNVGYNIIELKIKAQSNINVEDIPNYIKVEAANQANQTLYEISECGTYLVDGTKGAKIDYTINFHVCPFALVTKSAGSVYDTFTSGAIKGLLTVDEYSISGVSTAGLSATQYTLYTGDDYDSSAMGETSRLEKSASDVTLYVKTTNGNIGSVNIGPVLEDVISSIEVKTLPKTNYTAFDKFSSSGAVVIAKSSQGIEIQLDSSEYKFFNGNTELTSNSDMECSNNEVTVKLVANDSITTKYSISVAQKNINVLDENITIADQEYTGSQIKPEITVKYDTDKTLSSADYTATYGDNINCGNAAGSVTISPKETSNYTFAAITKTFKIKATDGSIKINETLDKTYDGQAVVNPTVTTNSAGTVSFEYYNADSQGNPSGTKLSSNPSNAGTYVVKAVLAADTNHGAASDQKKFTISKKTVTVSGITADNKNYDGTTTAVVNTSAAVFNGKVGSDVLKITAAGVFKDANVGTGKEVTISLGTLDGAAKDNYTLDATNSQKTATAEINKAEQVLTGTLTLNDWTYGQAANHPSGINAKFDATVSYVYATENNSSAAIATVPTCAGTYYVFAKVDGTNNYNSATSSTGKQFTIAQKQISEVTVTSSVSQNVVTAIGSFVEPTFKFENDTITGTLTYTVTPQGEAAKVSATTYADAVNALKALPKSSKGAIEWTFSPSGVSLPSKNYTGTTTGSIAFTMVDVEFKVGNDTATGDNAITIVGGTTHKYGDKWADIVTGLKTITASVNGTTGTDNNFSYQIEKDNDKVNDTYSAVGSYKVAVYYSGTVGTVTYNNVKVCEKELTIQKKPVELTWSNTSLVYNGQKQTPTAVVANGQLVGNDKLDVTVTGAQDYINVGTGYTANATIPEGNYEIKTGFNTTTFAITQKAVTVSGIQANEKVYDATTGVALSYSNIKFNGICGSDTLTAEAIGTFSNKNVGTSKEVKISNLTLGGTSVANYKLASSGNQEKTTATITQKEITVGGITANNKTYDATTSASLVLTGAQFGGKYQNDTLSVTANGEFRDKTVADGKTVDIKNLTLGGTDKDNYKLKSSGQQETATANITAKAVTIDQSKATIKKEYLAGNKDAGTLEGTLGLTGVISGDVVSVKTSSGITYGKYSSDAVGKNYTITMEGITLEGADAKNYKVDSKYTFTGAEITKVMPKLENVNIQTPAAAAYNKVARPATVSAVGTGLGTLSVAYRKFETGTGQAINASASKNAPVDAGKYYVEVSYAEGTNFGAKTLTSAAWVVEITQADRNFTLAKDKFTLVPGQTTAKIAPTVAQGCNIDNDVKYTYTSADTRYVYVDASGNVKGVAQTGGAIDVTVATAQTNNYKATNAAVKVASWVDPIGTISFINPNKGVQASTDGQTIFISGYLDAGSNVQLDLRKSTGVAISGNESISLSSADLTAVQKGSIEKVVTFSGLDSEKIGVKYTIKAPNLIIKPQNVNITPEKSATVSAIFDGNNKSQVQSAIEDNKTTLSGILEAAAKIAVDEQSKWKLSASDASKVSTYAITINTNIVAEAYTGGSLKLNIEPQYIIEAKTSQGSVVTSKSAVIKGTFDTAVKITVRLPEDSFEPKYAKHKDEYIPVTITGTKDKVATWYQNSFSPVELITDNPTASVTFNYFDGSVQVIEFNHANETAALPQDSQTGKTFGGWIIYDNGVATTSAITNMSETILRNISNGSSLTASPVFNNKVTPSRPNPGPGAVVVATETTYAISFASNANCTIAVNPTSAKAGETVKITVTPKDGYELTAVTAKNSADNSAVALTETTKGVYTFVMPSGDVTVNADVKKTEVVPQITFVDVPAGSYFEEAVKWAVSKSVTLGSDDTHFAPEESCTRAQVVTFLYRAAGSPKSNGTNTFKDVTSDEYYYDAVLWAVENGITQGVDAKGTKFDPNATCTRAQIVTFLSRYANAQNSVASTKFADVKTTAYYALPVAWAVENGITQGVDAAGTKFDPNGTCTRAQVVTFLYRYVTKVGEGE